MMTTAVQVLDLTAFIDSHMSDVKVPVLLLHGADDTVSEPESSRRFIAGAGSKDKTLNIYDGMWHTLLSEKEWGDIIYADILAWVEQRL